MKKSLLIVSMAVILPTLQMAYAEETKPTQPAPVITKTAPAVTASQATGQTKQKDAFDFSITAMSAVVKKVGDNKYQATLSNLSEQGVVGTDEDANKEEKDSYAKFNTYWHQGGANSFAEKAPMGTINIKGTKIPPVKLTDFQYNADKKTIVISFSMVNKVNKASPEPLTDKEIVLGKKYESGASVFVDNVGW